jgi:hypothetical protein
MIFSLTTQAHAPQIGVYAGIVVGALDALEAGPSHLTTKRSCANGRTSKRRRTPHLVGHLADSLVTWSPRWVRRFSPQQGPWANRVGASTYPLRARVAHARLTYIQPLPSSKGRRGRRRKRGSTNMPRQSGTGGAAPHTRSCFSLCRYRGTAPHDRRGGTRWCGCRW